MEGEAGRGAGRGRGELPFQKGAHSHTSSNTPLYTNSSDKIVDFGTGLFWWKSFFG